MRSCEHRGKYVGFHWQDLPSTTQTGQSKCGWNGCAEGLDRGVRLLRWEIGGETGGCKIMTTMQKWNAVAGEVSEVAVAWTRQNTVIFEWVSVASLFVSFVSNLASVSRRREISTAAVWISVSRFSPLCNLNVLVIQWTSVARLDLLASCSPLL